MHGGRRLYLRGVTYGTFAPSSSGDYPAPAVVAQDFARMREAGLDSVRVYTPPPIWLLDLAAEHRLSVLVGVPWEEHVAFLEGRAMARSIEQRVRAGVRACGGHPAILGYAVGNEIPASIVRWHGYRRVERFLARLLEAAKDEDGEGLVTYVNYPSTEYLDVAPCDVVAFNVYLESTATLAAYLSRLQSIAGDRPLVVAELGLDGERHGAERQAEIVGQQVRSAFRAGCAGAYVFSWTDEWYRGGAEVDGWAFGLTDRRRNPKPALEAARSAFADAPFPAGRAWPTASVIVCTHNGARTLRSCCEGLLALEYPDVEVVVVDDGSTDGSAAIASEYGFQVLSTPNRGLSSARNTGLAVATGAVVAYLDDDARPDPHWLQHLVQALEDPEYAGVGGPNLPPPGDGAMAECVASAPGGPIHVLLSDREAEHIPGCNMAFRRECLEAIGGFDPQFRIAGDDVDVCWRLQRAEWKLAFSPSALVWHHRRASLRGYLRQQREYGRAEALLERKWPAKYNAVGHLTWAGRLYGGPGRRSPRRRRIRYGIWGSGTFQTAVTPNPRVLASLPGMPEWLLLIAALGLLSAVGSLWRPLLLALPLLGASVVVLLVQAALGARRALLAPGRPRIEAAGLRVVVFTLHLLQPAARLWGRVGHGLTPWRRRGQGALAVPWPRDRVTWTERWHSPKVRLQAVGRVLLAGGIPVIRGGDYDRWELEVRGGALGSARLRMAIEEHGGGRQLARFRVWPRVSMLAILLVAVFALLAALAAASDAWAAAALLGAIGLGAIVVTAKDCATATGATLRAIERLRAGDPPLDAVEAGVTASAEASPARLGGSKPTTVGTLAWIERREPAGAEE